MMLDILFQHPGILYDVGYNVPTSWHGSVCPGFVAWFLRALSF